MKRDIFNVLFPLCVLCGVFTASAQTPPIEPGVSHELAKWRAARYSDVRYKLNLTLEKMSPVLKGTIEIRLKVEEKRSGGEKETAATVSEPGAIATGFLTPIILDWRKIRSSEQFSSISNVTVNGVAKGPVAIAPGSDPATGYEESNEHLIFRDGVRMGENVIKLDFTSPILTQGSAITRYVDKEDGAEYIYSLFVPSDASTAFPVFDQPDLKARFSLKIEQPIDWTKDLKPQTDWKFISNTVGKEWIENYNGRDGRRMFYSVDFPETKPISTYVFAFAAGPFERVGEADGKARNVKPELREAYKKWLQNDVSYRMTTEELKNFKQIIPDEEPKATNIYVRKSQAAKFKPHAAEVFRLNREGIKFLEQYFDYKFPFPKYDLVLIPEFPFGGMEHAGATFLRESSIIFPQEPTKSDYISRANLIFHEAAHQWFGDTVTMKWFDDLWLKEGFAEFMAYKTLERVMPDANAWKVFFERNKQAAYLTDSTKGTTPIYQEIANLNSAKSAYGNIVYRKAPSFLKQAEFYLGADKFQTAVRAFLKSHEYGNAGWEDLVMEFEVASQRELKSWAKQWVTIPGVPVIRTTDVRGSTSGSFGFSLRQTTSSLENGKWTMSLKPLVRFANGQTWSRPNPFYEGASTSGFFDFVDDARTALLFPNYQDYGYGIFLLDDRSRDYVLKNIGSEKDDFLRSMMWGSLWDSVREGELDPKEYVELAIRQLGSPLQKPARSKGTPGGIESDETIIQSLLGRVSTAMNYYLSDADRTAVAPRLEAVLLDRLQNAPTPGQRITFYRAFVANVSTAKGREVLKEMLRQSEPPAVAGGLSRATTQSGKTNGVIAKVQPPATAGGSDYKLRTKDRFDIIQRLIILGDPDALRLLADLEKTETTDDAKRYAYAARAGLATAENKAKYWNDFVNNKDISESWIEAAFGPWNSIRHTDLTLPYLERALKELPNHKRNRKIFFVNGWLGAFISGQRSEEALNIVNKFLADNPTLDKDLRLKILENVDLIERAVKIRGKYGK